VAYVGFKALQAKAGGGAKGAAIAAAVGRKKYGKQRFQQLAAEGRRRATRR
jgi:hypothetical protein